MRTPLSWRGYVPLFINGPTHCTYVILIRGRGGAITRDRFFLWLYDRYCSPSLRIIFLVVPKNLMNYHFTLFLGSLFIFCTIFLCYLCFLLVPAIFWIFSKDFLVFLEVLNIFNGLSLLRFWELQNFNDRFWFFSSFLSLQPPRFSWYLTLPYHLSPPPNARKNVQKRREGQHKWFFHFSGASYACGKPICNACLNFWCSCSWTFPSQPVATSRAIRLQPLVAQRVYLRLAVFWSSQCLRRISLVLAMLLRNRI